MPEVLAIARFPAAAPLRFQPSIVAVFRTTRLRSAISRYGLLGWMPYLRSSDNACLRQTPNSVVRKHMKGLPVPETAVTPRTNHHPRAATGMTHSPAPHPSLEQL